jgi:DivIVA domain-containing protein
MQVRLSTRFRGYDIAEVDALIRQTDLALASGRETVRASARQALRSATFHRRLRGYGRRQVKRFVEQRLQALSEARVRQVSR